MSYYDIIINDMINWLPTINTSHSQHCVIINNNTMMESLKPQIQNIERTALGYYDEAKEFTAETYGANLQKTLEAKRKAVMFGRELQDYFKDISFETINEMLLRAEKIAKVETDGKDRVEKQRIAIRVHNIYSSLMRKYLYHYSGLMKKRGIDLVQAMKQRPMEIVMPMYIHVKAVVLTLSEISMELLNYSLNGVKVQCQHHKNEIVMFFSGKFNEKVLRQKITEGIEGVKQLTINIVNRGLEIKIDRESVVKNYDELSVKLVGIVKQAREKGEENMEVVKDKSKTLYEQVLNRIKSKQKQIRVEMRSLQSKNEQAALPAYQPFDDSQHFDEQLD